MTLDPRILEQNLAALVARAYEPVEPSEAFREELVARALDLVTLRALERVGDVESRARGNASVPIPEALPRAAQASTDPARIPVRSGAARRGATERARLGDSGDEISARRRRLRYLAGAVASLAAAAAVVAFFFLGRNAGSEELGDILAGGRMAWRPLGDRAWQARALDRPLSPSELPFAAETPRRAGSKLLQDGARLARLAADAGVLVEREADGGVAFTLDHGALELASSAAPEVLPSDRREPTWRLASGAARVHLAHGVLRAERLRKDPRERVAVFLASGAAWALAKGVRVELAAGAGGILSPDGFVPDARGAVGDRDGVGRAPSGVDGVALVPDSRSDRAAVALTEGPADDENQEVADVANATTATLVLTVAAPQGKELSAARLAALQVSLVRVAPLTMLEEPEILRPARRADGAFPIGGVAAGIYRVDVAVDGFALWKGGPFALESGGELAVLAALEEPFDVRGVVVDPKGLPIAGAWVVSESDTPEVPLAMSRAQLMEQLAAIAVTDGEGRFVLALRSGEHVLRASHDDHAPGWSQDFVVGEKVVEQRIALQCGATIRGTVERVDGAPWTGADVIASTADILREHPRMSFRAAVTDAEGSYAISNLPPGSYAVLHFGSPSDRVNAGKPEMRILDLGACDDVQVDFTRAFTGARVFGRVTTHDGAPVAGMGLSLMVEGSNGRDQLYSYTGPDGAFELLEVPFASYSIFLTPDEGRTVVKVDDLVVPEWVAIERSVVVSSESVSGIVRDGTSGIGLPRAVVLVFAITSIDDQGTFFGRLLTDGEGRFRMPHLARGYYRLIFFSTLGDFGQEYVEDVLPTEDGRGLEVNLHPGGRLRVRVVDRGGAPIARASLVFVNEVGVRVSFAEDDSTDAAGQRLARGVKPGAWTVRVSAAGYADLERVVVVHANEEAAVELVLEQRER